MSIMNIKKMTAAIAVMTAFAVFVLVPKTQETQAEAQPCMNHAHAQVTKSEDGREIVTAPEETHHGIPMTFLCNAA